MLTLHPATPQDIPLILHYIKELAAWEELSHEVVADEASLHRGLFEPPITSYALIAQEDGVPIGFCLYFYNFSTFLGRKGLYVEDLYVVAEARGKGYGRAILSYLARKALDEGCGRLEWWVLDANTSAVEFYRTLEARPMSEWTVQRLEGATLEKLAALTADAKMVA
jgi:GNAT superfamily N-acetyltransferase